MKAQIPFGKRGKTGGISVVKANDVDDEVNRILSSKIHGFKVKELLIEEKVSIKDEWYLSLTLDRSNKCMTVIFSKEGGMDIEEVATKNPEAITKIR